MVPYYVEDDSSAGPRFRTLISETMWRIIQNGTANVGIMLSGNCCMMSVATSPRRIPIGELPASTPPPMAPTKSSRPRIFSKTTCLGQFVVRQDIASTTNGAYAPTIMSPIPAGHANVPGSKRNVISTRNIAPMIRHACIAVNRRRSTLSDRVRTLEDKAYAMRNSIGGRITASSKASGGLSGGLTKIPSIFRTTESAAHAATTSQTGKVLVDVFVIDPSFCDMTLTRVTHVAHGETDATSCWRFTHHNLPP